MAIEKILQTRIMNKVDTLENWNKSTLTIKQGEICFATVAASAGTGLTEPVVMAKIGTSEEKTFSELPWSFYAKASDVLEAAKDSEKLTAFINNVIADAKLGTTDDLNALAERVDTLEGDEATEGSVAKAIKDAIDALDLPNTYVAIKEGKSLVDDDEITKLEGVSEGANKVEASETNGNIKIDGVETVVYTHPAKHAIDDVTGLQDAIDNAKKAGTDAQANLDIETQARIDADSALDERVKAVEDMFGDGEGTVEAQIEAAVAIEKARAEEVEAGLQTQINTIMNNPDTKDVIDSIAEFTQYVADHGTIAEGMRSDINKNKEDIATNAGDIDSLEGRMDTAEEIIDTLGTMSTKSADDYYTKEEADATFTDSTEVDGQIDAKIEALKLGTMSKETASDYYTKEEADATFTDSTEVDGQIDAKIEALKLPDTYQAKGDYATAEQGSKADTALQEISTTENGGLKVTNKNQIDIDDTVVFVFDCGNSEVTAE